MDGITAYALSKKVATSAVSGVKSMSVDGQTLTINTKDSGVLKMVFPTPSNGRSVTDIDVNDKNQIVFTMSDGTEITSGVIPTVKGADGKPGKDGDPFTYDDFTKEQLEELKGKDGVSPTVTITESTGRHTISFYDKDGVKSITIKDGSPEDMANYYTKDETDEKLNLKANTSDIPIIPTNLSELNNDENYIKNTAENLTNYYKKTETYSQTEVNTLLANINKLTSKIVTELPSENISESTIYLIEVENQKNVYMQYMYINGSFATLGTTAIDLSNVYTKDEVDKKLEEKADKTEIPTIPTLISYFTNDKGYMTEFTETDPTVPAWAKTENKPSYTAAEVGALPEDTEIPIFINKTVLDGITSEKIKEWDAKSDFDGDYNSLINKPDTSNSEETKTHILTDIYGEEGVHGFRYYNNTLQVQNAEGDWFDVISGGGAGTIMPKPVSNATIKNKNAQCIITWQDPDDFVLDGVVLADWKGTKLVMSETSFPTNEQDGTLVVDNTEKGKYATDGYTVNNLVNGITYYFTLFTYSSDGAYNYKQAVHLTGQPSLVKLDPCANITAVASPEKVTVTWTDPDETKTVDGNTATWAKTVLVYKEGLDAPTSIDDGTVAVEEQTRNQYQTTGYDISGLEDGKDYSFSVFAISTENAISDKISTTTKLYAILAVKTSESKLYGKQVKAVSGSKTVTDTFNTSGQATLNIPWIGETTVTATDGTGTATKKVAISNYGQIYSLDLDLSLLKIVTFANGTDEEILDMIEAHYANKINIRDYWAVGDKRTVHLSAMSATGVGESHREQDVQMAIADFDHDDLTTAINGHTKAAVTLTQVDCLMDEVNANSPTIGSSNKENGYMNSTNTNSGGWTSSARRTWCNDVYYNALPDSFKSMVKPVKKLTSAGAQSTTINTTVVKVFLLSEVEIYGTTTNSVAGEGSQYTYYETASNRYKNPKWSSSSHSCIYWQRSPHGSNSAFFGSVYSNGSAGYFSASGTYGLAPCLCI